MQTIPNTIYKRAEAICDKFPTVDFLTIAEILNASSDPALTLNVSEAPAEEPKIPEPLPPTEEETPNLFDVESSKRRGRCHSHSVVIAGNQFNARNFKQLLRRIGIVREQDYEKIRNAIRPHAGDIVSEGKAFSKILAKSYGIIVDQFSAYDFDWRFCTVNLKNETFTSGENAE